VIRAAVRRGAAASSGGVRSEAEESMYQWLLRLISVGKGVSLRAHPDPVVTAEEDDRMEDVPTVSALVCAATNGDEGAWDDLVRRYLPLVYSVIRSYRLSASDAQDVSQTLWLRLVEHLDAVREPRALPGWIAVTTKNEALRLLKARGRTIQVDPMTSPDLDRRGDSPEPDDDLLRAERRQMLRDGLDELLPRQRELLLLLTADPPVTYQEISRRLNIPIGSIGPTRARYLERLRATSAMRSYFAPEGMSNESGGEWDNAQIR